MTNACKYELGKAWSAQYMIRTVHNGCNNESSELEKRQNYSLMSPKTSEIFQSVRSRIVILYKNGESYRKIVKKIGFTFCTVRRN